MSEAPRPGKTTPDSETKATAQGALVSPKPTVVPTAPGETTPVEKLTPEEQMALYEKELKETDWGHQPC